jgi:DNA-3-methyladenine glycosylase II
MKETAGLSDFELDQMKFFNILAGKSDVLADLLHKNGIPPIWPREPGFESLVRIILEQAVSLESARAVFEKYQKEIGLITPKSFLEADEKLWSRTGFSQMKWKTCCRCAEKVIKGGMNLFPTNENEDENLAQELIGLAGIGPWTVDIYFLLVLQRADIWPEADRALAVAVSQAIGLNDVMDRKSLVKIADPWKPYRSWAARIFWHDYLIRRNRLNG